jgi:hypothetical protein
MPLACSITGMAPIQAGPRPGERRLAQYLPPTQVEPLPGRPGAGGRLLGNTPQDPGFQHRGLELLDICPRGSHGLAFGVCCPLPVGLSGCSVEFRQPLMLSQVTHPGSDRPFMRLGGTGMCVCCPVKRPNGCAGPVACLPWR